jgi:hypothetical protein
VVLLVPVPNEQSDIAIWCVERDWDHSSVVDSNASETPRSTLHAEGWEVEEAPNLVLDLEIVCPVPTRRYRAVCAKNSILPAILSLLDTIPGWTKSQVNLSHLLVDKMKKGPISQEPLLTVEWRAWPGDEQRLIQAVEHIDGHVVVGGDIHDGARELLVDCDYLMKQ